MRAFFLLVLLGTPMMASANLVWPALQLETRVATWWAVTTGLVIEYPFVRCLFSLTRARAAWADLAANGVSSAIGFIAIPASGILWEIFPASIYNAALGWGTFNPLSWTATFLLAASINTVVEGLAYKKLFKLPLRVIGPKGFWLLVANMTSLGAPFASLWLMPPRL